MTTPDETDFWELAEGLLAQPGVTRSTMMGFPCLRLHRDFFASWDSRHHQLVVKLDGPTATRMIEAGQADPFAPAGRRFREWVALPAGTQDRWADVIREALAHAVRRTE